MIDLDNNIAGSYFLTAFHQTPPGNLTLNWIFVQAYDVSSNFTNIIENGEAWAVVYMNSNVTARINNVIESILYENSLNSRTYISSSAVSIIYDEGRNPSSINVFVLPAIHRAIAIASTNYSAYIQTFISSYPNATLNRIIEVVSASQIISSPIGFTDINLYPAFPFARVLATTLGYTFLWLIMSALVTVTIRITVPLITKIKIIDIAVVRILSSLFNSLIISLIYSLCVLWFGDFTQAIPFIKYWLFNWLASATFASIIALFTLNLGVIANVVLVLFLILNFSASGANLAIELQHQFYRIGYGLPLFHCFSSARHLLFGSYTRFNIDIGTLILYYVVCILLIVVTSVINMQKQQKLGSNKEKSQEHLKSIKKPKFIGIDKY